MSTLPADAAAAAPTGERPWGLACLLLALAGAFFFSSYGFANWLASQRAQVPTVYFGWERGIPFLPWTIIPYWSIDLLYGVSFFLWHTRAALVTHVRRLVLAQLVSVACFIAFPLRFSFERPQADGLPGRLFALLGGFDLPFNQAPSLHISLLVILWVAYAAHLRGGWRWLLHGWFALIGMSVLTTWQHHLIDVPTGALVGWLCVYLFPMRLPEVAACLPDARTRQLSRRYAAGAVVALLCAVLAVGLSLTLAFLLLWAVLALACVARIYALAAPAWFLKNAEGLMAQAARWVLAPYLLGAFLNSRWWTRRAPQASRIADGVWVGRFPTGAELRALGTDAVVDLSAELPRAASGPGLAYRCVPVLDLTVPSAQQLEQAVAQLDAWHAQGRRILVSCALGYSRSALVAAAWMARRQGVRDAAAALAALRAHRPAVVLGREHAAALQAWLDQYPTAEAADGR
ncbi:phosphatase PAP2/dual specificity phosphatase family protein [Cupriavidus consociatus]|uniref:phosphatase PAP2/dual specificity phosphatase family protein n=1 Tax=Cupriavidus consociatus TaxID=2821357 RepID=UPI001AE958DC|nr:MULTISPECIES: phosphatase PAP2/dual specificity phosphatase family protein [unclassified Cupriavidus]MBP0618700.1 phosphatase PAP2/dual specificity phosphatase family protein [Cupriavidus sp. LEh25]MDK2655340.1 phosphatase PAP2/dual specificity phosphatase family protein [Cupriavidus sp. LEh21]